MDVVQIQPSGVNRRRSDVEVAGPRMSAPGACEAIDLARREAADRPRVERRATVQLQIAEIILEVGANGDLSSTTRASFILCACARANEDQKGEKARNAQP